MEKPPTTAPKPSVEKKPSVVFEAPDLARPGETVSAEEIQFFVDNGFLVKKRLIEAAAVEEALGKIWVYLRDQVPMAEGATAPSPGDPSTWASPEWAPMPKPDESGPYQGRQRIAYGGHTVKLHDLGNADFLMDLVPNHPQVRAVAKVILGDDLRPSERTRGVYAVFPNASEVDTDDPERFTRSLGPHTDQVCQQLNACVYLDDVPARSGGFTVYPGSHQIMFRAHRFEANWSPLPDFRDALRRVVAEIEPVEFAGEKGDVIFWHGRTVHSAGVHMGDSIRWAVFADFTVDREVLSPEEHKRIGQFEWFKDAKRFAEDARVGEEMWRGWRLGH
ncbi:MAG: phytanoyl-CoA dioxygenase family protein [Gammaproteobacteria bacterium]|nr:phytanoyl-CoA dioxygenase family protein [Gammaproteobacteria bacterium]